MIYDEVFHGGEDSTSDKCPGYFVFVNVRLGCNIEYCGRSGEIVKSNTANSAGNRFWHNYCHLVVVKFEV